MKYAIGLAGLLLVFHQPLLAAEKLPYNQVSLNTSVSQQVDSDLFKATMTITRQVDGNRLAPPYDEVNKLANKAFVVAKRYKNVKAVTRSNATQPIYDHGKIQGWRIHYSIDLTTRDRKALSTLVGELQSFMKIDNLYFMVSDEKRKATEDALISKAIGQFNHRARIVAKAESKSRYELVRMNINTSRPGPIPMAREQSYMSMKSVTPPPIEAGTQTITVSISGTIELKK